MDEVISYLQQVDPLWAVVLVAIALAVLRGSSVAIPLPALIGFAIVPVVIPLALPALLATGP